MAYHKISSLVKVARLPVLLDESMVNSPGAVRGTVRDMIAARRRATEAIGFVPPSDFGDIKQVVVEAGRENPVLDGAELLVGPNVSAKSLLMLFGGMALKALGEKDEKKWMDIFQREQNVGKRMVTAADAAGRFVDAYVAFHLRPKPLRAEAPLVYSFFEELYGKRINQLWDIVGR